MSAQIEASVLIAGFANAAALVLDDTLSFWGGFNPDNGEIIDVHHPQFGEKVGGTILCIPESKGSAGTPGGIAETLRNGSGPVAFILAKSDVNIAVGTLVANKLYDIQIPVVEMTLAELQTIKTGEKLFINAEGLVTFTDR
ncbi:MAG: putative aconitase with swiveling domain [Gammaproteobacteria bacterium]|jgi:predicted aconitase with swiveling domain